MLPPSCWLTPLAASTELKRAKVREVDGQPGLEWIRRLQITVSGEVDGVLVVEDDMACFDRGLVVHDAYLHIGGLDGRTLGFEVACLEVEPAAVHAVDGGNVALCIELALQREQDGVARIDGELRQVGDGDAQARVERAFLCALLKSSGMRYVPSRSMRFRPARDGHLFEFHGGLVAGERELDTVNRVIGVDDAVHVGGDAGLQSLVEMDRAEGAAARRGRSAGR